MYFHTVDGSEIPNNHRDVAKPCCPVNNRITYHLNWWSLHFWTILWQRRGCSRKFSGSAGWWSKIWSTNDPNQPVPDDSKWPCCLLVGGQPWKGLQKTIGTSRIARYFFWMAVFAGKLTWCNQKITLIFKRKIIFQPKPPVLKMWCLENVIPESRPAVRATNPMTLCSIRWFFQGFCARGQCEVPRWVVQCCALIVPVREASWRHLGVKCSPRWWSFGSPKMMAITGQGVS